MILRIFSHLLLIIFCYPCPGHNNQQGPGEKGAIEIPRVYSSDKYNDVGCHTNTLLYYDERSNKASIYYHTKKANLFTSERNIFCHYEVIMASRDQEIKLGLDILRASIYYDSNIIGNKRNALLTDEGGNKVYKTDIDTASKPNLDITH